MIERPHTKPTLIATLALAAAFTLGACGGAARVAPPTTAPLATTPVSLAAQVSVADASALRDAGAFVLDVREPSEWASGHIPGATLIPLGELPTRLDAVPGDRAVLVVCRSGNRSAQGRDILRQAGWTTVTSMAGGMNEWIAAGLPVDTGP